MDTATVVVTLLLAALFTFSASIKLLGVSQSLAIRDHLGVSAAAVAAHRRAANSPASPECSSGLLWAPIGIAAAIGLALLSIGAIAFHCARPIAPRTWRLP